MMTVLSRCSDDKMSNGKTGSRTHYLNGATPKTSAEKLRNNRFQRTNEYQGRCAPGQPPRYVLRPPSCEWSSNPVSDGKPDQQAKRRDGRNKPARHELKQHEEPASNKCPR